MISSPPLSLQSAPVTDLSGCFSLPGDKSISHRAVMMASIAEGTSTIHGFLHSLDCLSTVDAFRHMGVSIAFMHDDSLLIKGNGKYGLSKPQVPLDVGNAGTAMRLLCGLLAPQPFDSVLIGDSSLTARPMARVVSPLTTMGASILSTDGHAPLRIKGKKTLRGIDYLLPIASAQVKSCLLLAGLYATGNTTITEPEITRDHTERLLKSFSYPLTLSKQRIQLNAASKLVATELHIPGCLSSAAFFIVAACITPGSQLTLTNVGVNPTRLGVVKILKAMGANIVLSNHRLMGEEPVADIESSYSTLQGITIPTAWVSLAIDEFPIIFVAAAAATGKTVVRGAKELRFKESDRIQGMVDALVTLGIEAESLTDGAIIQGGQFNAGVVDSKGDHRIAMALLVAGAIAKGAITVKNCNNIATSFPEFRQLATSHGMIISEVYDE